MHLLGIEIYRIEDERSLTRGGNLHQQSMNRWLNHLVDLLADSIVRSLGRGRRDHVPALVELFRPDDVKSLSAATKKQLQMAKRRETDRALAFRVFQRIGCEYGISLEPGDQERLWAFIESLEPRPESPVAGLLSAIESLIRPLGAESKIIERLAFARACFEQSDPPGRMLFGVDTIIASTAVGMALLRDPLDGATEYGWPESAKHAWLPVVHEQVAGALVPTRYRVLSDALTRRAQALGASEPSDIWQQAQYIGRAIDIDAETVRKRIYRQLGPELLDGSASTERPPISGDLIASLLALPGSRWRYHTWVATIDVVDFIQRSWMCGGLDAVEVQRAFACYPHYRDEHERIELSS